MSRPVFQKKILVTGAEGFIGSHLVEMLVRDGYNVRAMVLYNSFNSKGWLDHLSADVLDSVDFFMGDVRDPYGTRKAVDGCDAVMHLAALIGIPYSYHSPDSYVDTNIKGTLNILQASKDRELKKIVHTSTSEVYGTAQSVPIDEDHPMVGQSPYSASKIGADQMALSFYKSFNSPVAILRPFNTYGPRQSMRAVLPTIISQIATGKKEIALGSTHPTRDFTFVKDTARGFIQTLETSGIDGQVIQIGSNYEISIGDAAEMIAQMMKVSVRFVADELRMRPDKSEVERLWCNDAKAKRLIGWNPSFAGLEGFERGITETIEWFKNNSMSQKSASEYVV